MIAVMLSEETIFNAARRIPDPIARAAYLDEACGGDQPLRRRLDALLRVHESEDDFLASPAVVPSELGPDLQPPMPLTRPGTTIGPYKLLEQIGEGGFGVVFMADQQAPVRRTVALKILKPGMDTRQVIARFEAERQALALMDHPNIARVLDAGATEGGRPYFVMDLVRGIPITDYCDQNTLTTRERLGLFVRVCQAVQHAHQKGIIHRDLKPTNVLVTLHDGVPVPKVIDFGVAKAVGQQLTEKTLFTNFAQIVGTPLYMSPEQAEMSPDVASGDVDTRSDIYSLGVLLYELLTGTTPFDRDRLKKAAFGEMCRIIREEEPPRPSTRLSTLGATVTTVSAQRSTDPRQLGRTIRGELDWIVMKALEKDRSRRYETANGLAMDVQRYLSDEPVQACPPSAGYRLRKLARRHRAALIVATAFVVLLATATTVSTWQAVRATRAERQVVRQRDEVRAALTQKQSALARAKAESERAEKSFLRATIAIREVLTRAAIGAGEWSQLPAPLRRRISEEAVKFYESLSQEDSLDPNLQYQAAVGYRAIGSLYATDGEWADGEKFFQRSVAILDRLAGAHREVAQYRQQLAWSLLNLGRTLRNAGRPEEATVSVERATGLYETLVSGTPTSFDYQNELGICYRELSYWYRQSNDFKRAGEMIDRGISMLTTAASQHPDQPQFKESLAWMYLSLGQLRAGEGRAEEAKAALRAAAEGYERAVSKRQNAGIIYNWAWAYQTLMELPGTDPQQAMADAEDAYRQFLEVQARTPAELKEHRDLRERFGHVYRIWAFRLRGAGRAKEAEQSFLQAAALFDKLTEDEPDVAKYRDFATNTHQQLADLNRLPEAAKPHPPDEGNRASFGEDRRGREDSDR